MLIPTRLSSVVVTTRSRLVIYRVVTSCLVLLLRTIRRSTTAVHSALLAERMSTAILIAIAGTRTATAVRTGTTATIADSQHACKKGEGRPANTDRPFTNTNMHQWIQSVVQRRGRRELDAPELERGFDAEV